MHIPEGMHKIPHFQPANLRHHMGQQGIGSDIERHTQKHVSGSLVKLARQASHALRVFRYIKLEQAMAGSQFHLRNIRRVPGRHNQPP